MMHLVMVVLANDAEAMNEAQGGHQQGHPQEEQHPLAHASLMPLQVHAQEVDTAVVQGAILDRS